MKKADDGVFHSQTKRPL